MLTMLTMTARQFIASASIGYPRPGCLYQLQIVAGWVLFVQPRWARLAEAGTADLLSARPGRQRGRERTALLAERLGHIAGRVLGGPAHL